MAIDDNKRDDNLERDPRIARLLEAAGGEEPPVALDAAILAAARREVHARPQVAGGGEAGGAPPVRAKRNWFVPVSIAAVLVLSVSLVRLVQEEKGAEVVQPPRRAATAPAPEAAPAPAAPASVVPEPPIEKADAMLRDAAQAKSRLGEAKRTETAKEANATAAPEADRELAKSKVKIESAADGAARKDQPAEIEVRQQRSASDSAAALRQAPAAATGVPADAASARERRAEPFPAASERVAPAFIPPPAKPAFLPPPRAARLAEKSAPLWRELEDQPPEKWLERLAEFKRDKRQADADELLAEFRRRFPNHPASER